MNTYRCLWVLDDIDSVLEDFLLDGNGERRERYLRQDGNGERRERYLRQSAEFSKTNISEPCGGQMLRGPKADVKVSSRGMVA